MTRYCIIESGIGRAPGYAVSGEPVHSQTLPLMSCAPSGVAPRGKLPTRTGPDRDADFVFAFATSGRAPYGYARPATPRAAASHSISDGKRPPRPYRHAQ